MRMAQFVWVVKRMKERDDVRWNLGCNLFISTRVADLLIDLHLNRLRIFSGHPEEVRLEEYFYVSKFKFWF
jgi:hypothetical protein